MKKIFIITIILFVSKFSFAWDSTSAKYLPLQVGNVWVYRSYNYTPLWHCDAYEKYTITGTAQINGKTYFAVQRVARQFSTNTSNCGSSFFVGSRLFRQHDYIRIDSSTANIYSTDTCLIDSLAAREGDSTHICASSYSPVVCDTSIQLIFGYYKPAKNFICSNFEMYQIMWYIKDFGFVRYHWTYPGPCNEDMLLKGCIINRVLYGDTNTMVGINQISNEVPDEFVLHQNYPNPFNPVTKIRFDIPPSKGARGMTARLIIYDVLGREIATLVNEQLIPGTYEVEWNGSAYSSGVYFYTLTAGDPSTGSWRGFIETKKMVLIK